MSDNEILNLILTRVNQIDEKLERLREHHSKQMSRVHRRIDDTSFQFNCFKDSITEQHNNFKDTITEKHNAFEVECKKNDTKMERRIGVVGTAAALITSFGVKLLELIFQFIPKVIK